MYAGIDPITRRQLYFRATVKDETQAKIELGKLLEKASAGRQPESSATVAKLVDQYSEVADWDAARCSTCCTPG